MQIEAYTGVDNLEVMQEAVNYNRHLLNTVRKYAPAGGKVLDFGAGSGQFAAPLAQLGLDVTALEPDETLHRRLAAQGLQTATSLLQLAQNSVDYVYSLNVLEHIDDDTDALRQLHGKLVPGGKLLIYVPAFPILYTSMDAKVGHVRRYRRQSLLASVRSAGFTVDSVGYVDSLGFLAALAFKWLDNGSGAVNRTALKLYDRCVFPISLIVDHATRRWLGKNLLLLAHRPRQ